MHTKIDETIETLPCEFKRCENHAHIIFGTVLAASAFAVDPGGWKIDRGSARGLPFPVVDRGHATGEQ
jgi:hypothetical protein